MNEVDRIEGPGSWSVGIYHDEDAGHCDPRDNDNLCRLVCFHKRYELGDKHDYGKGDDFTSWEDVYQVILDREGPLAWSKPVFMYDHGGVALSLGEGFSCPWDSGQVGFMFVTTKAREAEGIEWCTIEKMEEVAKIELSEYEKWCNGEVYGYIVTCEDGDKDSCWGFIGQEWAIESAKEAMQYAVQAEQEALELERNGFAL